MSAKPLSDIPDPSQTVAPASWRERRRAAKAERLASAARNRVIDRLVRLGPDWRILDARSCGLPGDSDFLLFGPGGIFALQVKSQGRARVMLAGDVVQIDGKRPPHIAAARRAAKIVADTFSWRVGRGIPVTPFVVFVGSGQLSVFGLPQGCLVSHFRELEGILVSRGTFLSSRTVDTLYKVAARPATWSAAPPRAA